MKYTNMKQESEKENIRWFSAGTKALREVIECQIQFPSYQSPQIVVHTSLPLEGELVRGSSLLPVTNKIRLGSGHTGLLG